jgi:protein gp37
VPDEFIAQVFDVMAQAPRHVFQVLTKRPDRLLAWQRSGSWPHPIPRHIWLGVSVESTAYLWRVDRLREVDVAIRFISAEPLLGPLTGLDLEGVSWVITGGESAGPPERALVDLTAGRVRPKAECVRWVRQIRDLCRAEEVAFFHKQWGGRTRKSGGRLLDGRERSEYPETRGFSGATP